jgi:hypothetical protein
MLVPATTAPVASTRTTSPSPTAARTASSREPDTRKAATACPAGLPEAVVSGRTADRNVPLRLTREQSVGEAGSDPDVATTRPPGSVTCTPSARPRSTSDEIAWLPPARVVDVTARPAASAVARARSQ